jgi:Family of unknown function (DUF5999)
MHPAMRRQSAAGHIREPATGAGDARPAGKRDCRHRPRCPDALSPGRSTARIVAHHPGQGWSLLCNGGVLFDDGGALLPDGRAVAPAPGGPVWTAA